MSSKFDFNHLFIFDLANNHQGDVKHGLRIIREIADVAKNHGVRGAIKFQFRKLDNFIHPDYRNNKENKHIQRFLSTRLSRKDLELLLSEVRNKGMLSAATPFDEDSVDLIMGLDIDIIKVASCSALDKPLLDRIIMVGKPVIVSTAGLSMNHIDRLVSFLEHKNVLFALMHCVALYPTPYNKLNLNQIEVLKTRFPDVPIGFSTHEEPENYAAVKVAYAKGARIFERHVGVETSRYKLNAYSSNPKQISLWLDAYHEAVKSCGGEHRAPASPEEISSLRGLMRGVFAEKEIKRGERIKREDIFFAMPLLDGQLASGEWNPWMIADKDYFPNEPINADLINLEVPKEELVYQIILQVKGMLNNARIFIGRNSSIELSHHYGLERFREFGCVIVNCINRAYAKKLIILLPRQKHPYHYHKKKEETFQLLYGDLEVEVDGEKTKFNSGDTLLMMPNQWHKFHTLDGAIFEEISTTHHDNDSFYEDERIARVPREKRKTTIENWEKTITDIL